MDVFLIFASCFLIVYQSFIPFLLELVGRWYIRRWYYLLTAILLVCCIAAEVCNSSTYVSVFNSVYWGFVTIKVIVTVIQIFKYSPFSVRRN